MASIPNSPEEQFEQQAANDWALESLYKDLESAKQIVAPHKRKGLTADEKQRLCGLLCGYSPAELAQKLVKSTRGVEAYLCETVYRYVEQLTKRPRNTVKNWRDIPEWLEKAGYKTQLSESVKGEGAIANPNAPVSQADESNLDALVEKVRSQTDASIAEILRILQGIKQNEQLSISSANLISMPPTLENWQGRNQEIQKLQAWLADTKVKTVGIQGLSGVGKSWLAAYLYEAIEFESKFWADVRQGTDFTVFAQNALMKLAGKSPEELAALREPEQLIFSLLESLRQRSCLLVVDNLETLLDQERHFLGIYKDFFNRWIEHGAVSTLLLTTQTQPEVMEGHGCWLALQGLEATEGARLLQELGILGSDEELQNFSRYLNGHPKMLRLAASKLKPGSHVREAEKLHFRQLDQLLNEVPMPYRDRERVLFVSILEQHFQALSPMLQSFFLNLSLFRSLFERDAASVVLTEGKEPVNAWETQQALDELVSRSMLEEIRGEQQQYEFHPFVLQYAKQKAGNQPQALRYKLIAYYQAIASDRSNWETLNDVAPYLEIFYHYCELKEYIQAFYTIIFNGNDYENCIDNFLNLRGYNAVRASLYDHLVQSWQEEASESEMWEFEVAHTCLGDALMFLGQYHRAIDCFQQSRKTARQTGDLEVEAGSLINIGLAYHDLKDFKQAFEYTRKGLNLAAENGYHEFEANALNNMGLIYFGVEEYPLAIGCYERSLTIKQAFGYYQSDASSLINLGDAYRCLGQHDKAIKFLEQGINIAKQAGDRRFEANGWFNLALAKEAREDLELQSEAIAAYKNARERYQAMGLDERVREANDAIRRLCEALDGSED